MNKQVCISKPYESLIKLSDDVTKIKTMFDIDTYSITSTEEIFFRADLLGALMMTGHISRSKYKKFIKSYIHALEGKYKLWSKKRAKVVSIELGRSIDVEKNIAEVLNTYKIPNKRIFGKGYDFVFITESETYTKQVEQLIRGDRC
jgi:hypothetical protein